MSAAATGYASTDTKFRQSQRCASAFHAAQVVKKLRPRPKPVSNSVNCVRPRHRCGKPQPVKNTATACARPPERERYTSLKRGLYGLPSPVHKTGSFIEMGHYSLYHDCLL